jgi:predicted TIM-barrel fold metal-dependent hydrolase
VTYAGPRRIIDADSHLMEWPTFLTDHAPASIAGRLPPMPRDMAGRDRTNSAVDAVARDDIVGLGDDLVRRGPKWHQALGAMDPAERSTALDLLGFERQVVYSSFCAPVFDLPDDVRYAAYRAHNESMAAFCAADRRLLGVAMCDLDDPDRSITELHAAVDLGLALVWIPARAPGGCSPGHRRNDAFWAALEDRRVPFVLHVGSGPFNIASEWTESGDSSDDPNQARPEIIGSKDLMVIYHAFERFLATLVLDGTLERFPELRGGAIEVGAGWVPDMIRRLDHAVTIWSRSEPRLAGFQRLPSEQAAAQLRFTPYAFEDVGQLCRESNPCLYLFSTDYPHAEGGRDPIGRFDRTLADQEPGAVDGFYARNAADWLRL